MIDQTLGLTSGCLVPYQNSFDLSQVKIEEDSGIPLVGLVIYYF